MRLIRVLRDMDVPAWIDRKNCKLCRVWGVLAFKASPTPIPAPQEAADALIAAGAAEDAQT